MSQTIKLSWISIVDFEDAVMPMTFDMEIAYEPTDTTPNTFQAIDRIRTLENHLEDSVFIHEESPSIDFYLEKNINIMNLPEDPNNMMIGLAILKKIAAITEQKIIIKGASIMNSVDPDIRTEIDPLNMEFLDLYCNKLGYDQWYVNPNPVFSDINRSDAVDLWSNYGLDWHTDESAEVRVTGKMVSTWSPKVIIGGKS